MKPESSSSDLNREQLPSHVIPGVEKAPITDNPETGIEKGADAYEKKSEMNATRADIGLTTVLPAPVTDTKTTADDTAISITADDTAISNNPAVANDDDLIEKEWVDKAKKIVADTQDNPFKQDDEVNKLQVDYLKKRFGRELGVTE